MSNLSRRTLVSSAVVLPALAVPALASFSPDHPDAELLRLGVQLEPIGREADAYSAECRAHSQEWEAACIRAGLPRIEWYDWPGGEAKMDEWREHQNKRMALMPPSDHEVDEDGASVKWNGIRDRLYPLTDEILTINPKTVDGLRVQARALALSDPELWSRAEESSSFSDFLSSVFAFLGLDEDGNPIAA